MTRSSSSTEYVKEIRDIDNFDTITNLQALIVDDLRKVGVKIPHRRDLSSMRAPATESRKVQHFKNYLGYVPCYYMESFGHVPSFLVRAGAVIEKNIAVEGIFRKSGSLSRQKKVEEDVENEYDVSTANIFDITSLIKQFFRELREPLLTNIYHDAFLKCQQIRGNTSTKSGEWAAIKLCLLLPPEHLSTLRFTMNLFAKIAANSEQNKMTIRNLALVMAPSIMHSCNKGEKANVTEEKLLPMQTSLLELLISQEKNIGLVSSVMYERAEQMTACFGNVMEPEHSSAGGNIGGTRKKERRSGSLQGFVNTIAQSISRWRQGGNNSSSSVTQNSPEEFFGTSSQPNSTDETAIRSTPVILRKRKAPIETTAPGLSASKRKAGILGEQPLLPNTPSSKKYPTGQKGSSVTSESMASRTTPTRSKTSPHRKTKYKPFFQVLRSSKNSKKIEELKSKEMRPHQTNVPGSDDNHNPGEDKSEKLSRNSTRRQKRSASPFRRFLKRKKEQVTSAPSEPPEEENLMMRRTAAHRNSTRSPMPVSTVVVAHNVTDTDCMSVERAKSFRMPMPVGYINRKNQHDQNQYVRHKEATLSSSEAADSDSDQSDAGFSTISGGTVIFVPKSASADPLNTKHNVDIAANLTKRGLIPCEHTMQKCDSGVLLPVQLTSLSRSIDSGHGTLDSECDTCSLQSKRCYSATDTKPTHRPNAVASLKLTKQTQKILQRAQVPRRCLVQPDIIPSIASPCRGENKSVRRASSANESSEKANPRFHPVYRTSSLTVQHFPALKSDVLLMRRCQQQQTRESNMGDTHTAMSPLWSRFVDEDGKPISHNTSGLDLLSPSPRKYPRLHRVSSPSTIKTTPDLTPGTRQQTEYKQMIMACLNSPNLYKGISSDCVNPALPLRRPRRPRSLDGTSDSMALAIRQKLILNELQKRQQMLTDSNLKKGITSEKITEDSGCSFEKENKSAFLSPAPILKYRKERLPMTEISTGNNSSLIGHTKKGFRSPRPILQDYNQSTTLTHSTKSVSTPLREMKGLCIKQALTPTPVKLRRQPQMSSTQGHNTARSPLRAIHRPLSLYENGSTDLYIC